MQKIKRLLAIFIIVTLSVMQLPMTVLATGAGETEQDSGNIGEGGEIMTSDTIPEETTGTTPPSITMTVGAFTGTVTAFDELPDEIRWQNTTEPILPEKVGGMVEGETAKIPVTWEADHYYDADSPESGLYVFEAVLAEGHILSDGVEPLIITVFIPETVSRMGLMRMSGTGTNTDPLEITTGAQLAEVAELVNAGRLESFLFNNSEAAVFLELKNDLVLSAYGKDWNGGKGWKPIGTYDNPFKGHFEGTEHTIAGLYINDTINDFDFGLFGCVSGGTVQNLGLEDISISTKGNIGGLAGRIRNSSIIKNCYTTGSIGMIDSNTCGGLVGSAALGSIIESCYSSVSVSGSYVLGGLAGLARKSSIQNCYATGIVKGSHDAVGGLVGQADGDVSISSCAALGPSVEGYSDTYRILGQVMMGGDVTLSGNVAFSGMTLTVKGITSPATSDEEGNDGADITATTIKEDGSIGGRFAAAGGWKTENGKLPGLFGTAIELPGFIAGSTTDINFPGEGTEASPFLIGTPDKLALLATLVNGENTADYNTKHYKLIADIDLSDYGASYNGNKGWVPIGTQGNPFKGTFNGGGKSITGLYIKDINLDYAGLFCSVNEGTLENFSLNAEVRGGYEKIGTVAGLLKYSTLQNCHITGYVKGDIEGNTMGGIAGGVEDSSIIKDCFSAVMVEGGAYNVGGVAGAVQYNCSIENCIATGAIYADNTRGNGSGGIIGISTGSVTVKNCAALNPLIRGFRKNRVVGGYNGDYSAVMSGNIAFDLMGNGYGTRIADTNDDKGFHGANISAEQLQVIENLPSVFNSAPWTSANAALPGLFGKTEAMPSHITEKLTSFFAGGDGTQSSPYQISTAAQLAKLAELVNSDDEEIRNAYNSKHYKLMNDIDLSDYGVSNINFNGGRGWIPIGTLINYYSFQGNFEGNYKIITGLSIKDSNLDNAGLFGDIFNGTVKNLGIVGMEITAKNAVGGLTGSLYNNNINMVQNCYATGNVTGNNYVGGLIGSAYGNVQNCYTAGNVNGYEYVGGLAGEHKAFYMINCYSTATINGSYRVGGLVGNVIDSGVIRNCVALNSYVNCSNELMGRIIGSHVNNNFEKNYAFSGMKVNGVVISDGADNNKSGADISVGQIYDDSFWIDLSNWKSAGWDILTWTIEDDKLPILKGFDSGTQSGDGGIYLIERNIANATVGASDNLTYNGSQQIPALNVTFDGTDLIKDKDYTIAITSIDGAGTSGGTNAGEVTIKLVGKGNFYDEKTGLTYTINKKTTTVGDLDYTVNARNYSGLIQPMAVTAKAGINGFGTITVKYNGNTGEPKNAGTYAVTIDIAEGQNYSGVTGISLGNYTINKSILTISGVDVTKTYDGTTGVNITGVSFNGLADGETLDIDTDYAVSDAEFNSADAGNDKLLTGAVTLVGNDKTDNYTLPNGELSLTNQTIAKAITTGINKTLNVVKNHAENYDFELNTLLPIINSPMTMGTVTYAPVIGTDTDGVLAPLNYIAGNDLTIPVNSVSDVGKTADITVTVSSTNYNDFTATITVNVIDTIPLTVSGLTVDTKTYDKTNTAILSGAASLITTNVQTDDEVILTGTPSAIFADANVGTGKTVAITGLSLTGKDRHKYHLDLSDFTGTIEPKSISDTIITVQDGPFIYNGTEQKPTVTVKDGGITLILGVDYTVSYSNNKNAGTAIIYVWGESNYKDVLLKYFEIAKAPLTIAGGTVETKTYDNTTSANINAIIFDGLQNGETLAIVTGYEVTGSVFDSENAGGGKTVTGTVTLLDTPTTANYTLSNNSVSISGQTITKATATGVNQTLEMVKGHAKDYEFDINTLLPNVTGTLGGVTYSIESVNNTEGVLATVPSGTVTSPLALNVANVDTAGKTAAITIRVSSTNYSDFTATITIKIVEKTPVSILDVTMAGGIYNGSPYAYTGTPEFTPSAGGAPVKITNFDVLYSSTDGGGYSASAAPADAGAYQLTISVPDSNLLYIGSKNFGFTIAKRPVTIKADNKSMTRGGKMPTFTFTVDGQLSGETALTGIPTLTCGADGKTTGSYPITVDLAGIGYTANYLASTPASVDGTLTVNNPSSGGSGGTSTPVEAPKTETRVEGNIVTATTTVAAAVDSSGSLTGTVTNRQISDAIDKAVEEVEKQGEDTQVRVEVKMEASADASSSTARIPWEAVSQASKAGIDALTITTSVASITFDASALSTLSGEATGDVNITASKVDASTLPAEAQQRVGDRPVFDFSVTSGNKTISQFGGDVSVSIPYTPKEGEDTNAIVIYYINTSGELEAVSNCVYDPTTGSISFTTRHFSQYAVGYNKVNFKDVAEEAWYCKAISFIAAREITSGTGVGNFSPEAKLTRGQFIVMLMKAYGIAPDTDLKDNFADAGSTYYTGYLAAAKRLGISAGVGNNMFAPKNEITRQEMFTLLYNALKLIGKLPQGKGGKPLSSFTDSQSVAPWAKEAMTVLVESGTVSGNGKTLSPNATTTRAEMAQVLFNLLSK